MHDYQGVKVSEFLRKIKRHAANQKLSFRWVPSRGKGSHGTLYLGENGRTTVPDLKKELPDGTFKAMCAKHFIDPMDL